MRVLTAPFLAIAFVLMLPFVVISWPILLWFRMPSREPRNAIDAADVSLPSALSSRLDARVDGGTRVTPPASHDGWRPYEPCRSEDA